MGKKMTIQKHEDEQINIEPELRPEYKAKLAKIVMGKHLSRKELEKYKQKTYK